MKIKFQFLSYTNEQQIGIVTRGQSSSKNNLRHDGYVSKYFI